MIPLNLRKIALIINAEHIGVDIVIKNVTINSCVIKEQCMFIALIGNRFDGHHFAEQAVFFGAQALLVNRYLFLNVPQLIVNDTHLALIKLAKWIRRHISLKVLAITGSSGKTSVKDMTNSILQGCGKVTSTQNNFNNLIGVPMTILRLTKENDYAVIELGSSNKGEIQKLSNIVSADIALVNNIYPAHLLGFKSLIEIKKEKGQIFLGLSNNGRAIINADNHACSIWNSILQGKKIWSFSVYKTSADFFSSNIIYHNHGIQFILHTPFGKSLISLSMFGIHNVANALAASALAISVGANLSQVRVGLQNMQPIPGRLYPTILNKGRLLLLDDTYNSNVGSMISSIYVLTSMPGYRILIISDMLELGKSKSIKYHRYIGKLIKNTNIHQVCTIGKDSYVIIEICKKGQHFQNKIQLISYLQKLLSADQQISIIVKGSRNFQMEQITCFIKDKFTCFYG